MRWPPSCRAFARLTEALPTTRTRSTRTPRRRVASPTRSRCEQVRPRLRRPRGAARRARLARFKRPRTGRKTTARAACRGRRCSTRTRRCWRGSRTSSATPTPISRRGCATSWPRRSTPTKRPRLASGRSTSSTCWCAPAIWCAARADVRRRSSGASRTCSSTSSRTPTRCRPRSCCCSRPTTRRDDWRAVRPMPGKLFVVGDPKQSIYRFRRADVGIYESVREQLRSPRRRVRRAAPAASAPCRHPARRERGVRAADDRRRGGRPGVNTCRWRRCGRPSAASRRSSRCRCRRRTVERRADEGRRSPKGAAARGRPRSSTGSSGRAAGR